MEPEAILRQQLVALLTKRQAHYSFEDVVDDFPIDQINTHPPHTVYSFWHLIEHLRLAQLDILDYIRDPNYSYPNFPDDYWPSGSSRTDAVGWQASIDQFLSDRQVLADIVMDPKTDLTAQLPHGQRGHNILREVMVAADHNAYHVGEFGILRGVMDLW
ncbi:MAG: DinB family protein [Chloroflexi bacterium]|nr:DinB family protein [Chloroflexota bacterium]